MRTRYIETISNLILCPVQALGTAVASVAKQHKAATAAVSILDSLEPLTVCRPSCASWQATCRARDKLAHALQLCCLGHANIDIRMDDVNQPLERVSYAGGIY